MNLQLAVTLLRSLYPKEVFMKFQDETMNFQEWDNYFTTPEDPEFFGEMTEKNQASVRKAIVFFEALFVAKINARKDIEQLEYQLDRLTTQLSMGNISEATFNKASKRIEDRIQKLKSLEKSKE